MPIYEFGSFILNTAERRLTRDGQAVAITGKAFDVLNSLVLKSGSLVLKDELLRTVWPNSVVEENNLTVTVAALRKALGDDKVKKYIETVPGHGYRFVARVRDVQNRDTYSLAVLPFANDTGDPNLEYLCDGITESLINSLSQLRQLKVLSRNTVFRAARNYDDPLVFAREFHLSALLAGRVVKQGETWNLGIELIDVADGTQIWGAQYHWSSSDILPVLEQVARTVSERLPLQPSMETAKLSIKRYTNNTEAYHLYLKGRYCWDKYSEEWIRKSINYFRQAIDLDPSFALAYAGLADAYFRISATYLRPRDVWPMTILAATRAVEIDADLPEARASMGLVKHYHDHDWDGAEKEYQRAIELNPSSSLVRHRYGRHLLWAGRFEEALAEFERAKELDPLSLQIGISIGTCFYLTRQFERAVQQLEKVLELDPNHYATHVMLGLAQIHDPDLAIREFKLAFKLGRDYLALAEMGYVYAISGNEAQASKLLDQLLQASQRRYVSPYCVALIYAGLGRTDQAFEALEKLYEERDEMLVYARVAPEFDGLRADPRFTDLLVRAGLGELKA